MPVQALQAFPDWSPLLFDVDPDLLSETMTALGGARLWWCKCFDP
jgi:hypothetical protein